MIKYMQALANNILEVRQRIQKAAIEAGRNADGITLLAVSKTKPATMLRQAYRQGLCDFGENYLQEALAKQREVQDLPLVWHFIGPLQSNKTRAVAESFAWVHSVDRLKIAQRLSEQRPSHLPALNVCLQVNIDGEASKSGFAADEVLDIASAVAALPGLHLRGLMALPKERRDYSAQCQAFARVRQLFLQLQSTLPNLDTLSMGMSGDLEAAIAEGATIVRIGSAIFGERDI